MTMNPTLLLVDDDRLSLTMIAKSLTKAGYLMLTAESVDEAEAILASGAKPNLVILDVNMPERSGLELAERLRGLDHIPFIMQTAYSDEHIVEQATTYGALGYLVKPVDTPHLLPAITAALARAAEIQALQITGQQLQRALDGEREISIATGITMVQYRLDRKAAFELLRRTSRSQNRKLADVAASVIQASEALNLGG